MDIVDVLTKFSEWFADDILPYRIPDASWPSNAEFRVMILLFEKRHRLFASALKRSYRAQCLSKLILTPSSETSREDLMTCTHLFPEMSEKSGRYYTRHMATIRAMITEELCNNHH